MVGWRDGGLQVGMHLAVGVAGRYKVEIIDGCGHAVQLEAPDVVAEKVTQFLG